MHKEKCLMLFLIIFPSILFWLLAKIFTSTSTSGRPHAVDLQSANPKTLYPSTSLLLPIFTHQDVHAPTQHGHSISIHIPPNLRSLRIPLSSFLAKDTQYARLVCSAFIFTPALSHRHHNFHANEATTPPRLLLLRRSFTDTAFPNLWEIPGGSVDKEDPTILHGLAREVFEETGLRLTRFVRLVGEAIKWTTTEGDGTVNKSKEIKWMKLSFEIEVAESGELKMGVDKYGDERCLPVDLDPQEHQDHA
ncbi:MAG: hypothetical protein Q9198_007465 [Flavoplaca austrocitrina]